MRRFGSARSLTSASGKSGPQKQIITATFIGSYPWQFPTNVTCTQSITCKAATGIDPPSETISIITTGAGNSLTQGNAGTYSNHVVNAAYIAGGDYFAWSDGNNFYYVYLTVNGSGSDPGIGNYGIVAACTTSQTLDQVCATIISAMTPYVASVSYLGGGLIEWTTSTWSDGNALQGFTLNGIPLGNFVLTEVVTGICSPYFYDDSPNYIFYTIDGVGAPPYGQAGNQGPYYEVDISSSDSAATVASKTYAVLQGVYLYNQVSSNVVSFVQFLFGDTNLYDENTNFTFSGANAWPAIQYFEPSTQTTNTIQFIVSGQTAQPINTSPLISVNLLSTDTAAQVATKLAAALTSFGYTCTGTSPTVTFQRLGNGTYNGTNIGDFAGSPTGLTVAHAFGNGVGVYWTFQDSTLTKYAVWYNDSSYSTAPSVPGYTLIQVQYSEGSNIASATKTYLVSAGFAATFAGNVVTLPNSGTGAVQPPSTGTVTYGLTLNIIQVGR